VFVAAGIAVALWIGLGIGLTHPVWALFFAVMGSAFLGGLGLLAAIFAEKFDHMAAITNFIITPLSFLSGTFYSIERLPTAFEVASRLNPVFYLIDGMRYSVIGQSDSSPWLGAAVSLVATGALLGGIWALFRSGYRLKD
jgi:ABC-2 type transport system permease protein